MQHIALIESWTEKQKETQLYFKKSKYLDKELVNYLKDAQRTKGNYKSTILPNRLCQ